MSPKQCVPACTLCPPLPLSLLFSHPLHLSFSSLSQSFSPPSLFPPPPSPCSPPAFPILPLLSPVVLDHLQHLVGQLLHCEARVEGVDLWGVILEGSVCGGDCGCGKGTGVKGAKLRGMPMQFSAAGAGRDIPTTILCTGVETCGKPS